MRRCPSCGAETSNYQEYCYHCGAELKHVRKRPKTIREFNLTFFIIGVLFPYAAVVAYFFIRRERPAEAPSFLYGALADVVFGAASMLFYFVLGLFATA